MMTKTRSSRAGGTRPLSVHNDRCRRPGAIAPRRLAEASPGHVVPFRAKCRVPGPAGPARVSDGWAELTFAGALPDARSDVAADPIPLPVRQFVAEHISSAVQLELLLLLRRDPARAWPPAIAAREMRMPVSWAAGQLAAMRATGLLAVQDEREPAYCYAPPARLARVIDDLADAYRNRKTRVVSLIFEDSSDAQAFADAFRIRRRD